MNEQEVTRIFYYQFIFLWDLYVSTSKSIIDKQKEEILSRLKHSYAIKKFEFVETLNFKFSKLN